MPRGHLITSETRSRIADVLIRNPTWIAKEIQAEVDRQMGGRAPGLSAVQKEVTKLRKRVAKAPASELDKSWNLSTLSEHDLPPKIIPILIEMQKLKKGIWYSPTATELTVRQARWVCRLYYLIAETYLRKFPQATDELKRPLTETGRGSFLWTVFVVAASYAQQEITREFAGKEYGGLGLDSAFFIDELYWEMSVDNKAAYYAEIRALSKVTQWDFARAAIKKARRKERRSNKLGSQKSQ
jgi:hypothetical protein